MKKTSLAMDDDDSARRKLLTKFIEALQQSKGTCKNTTVMKGMHCHLPKGHEAYDMVCCSGWHDIGNICRSMTLLLMRMRLEEKGIK